MNLWVIIKLQTQQEWILIIIIIIIIVVIIIILIYHTQSSHSLDMKRFSYGQVHNSPIFNLKVKLISHFSVEYSAGYKFHYDVLILCVNWQILTMETVRKNLSQSFIQYQPEGRSRTFRPFSNAQCNTWCVLNRHSLKLSSLITKFHNSSPPSQKCLFVPIMSQFQHQDSFP